MTSAEWVSVTADDPCPACRATSGRCEWSADGEFFRCDARGRAEPLGWLRHEVKDGVTTFLNNGLDQGARLGRRNGRRQTPSPPPRWEPFPVDVLPPSLHALVQEGGEAINCDPALLAVSSLAACGGAVGLARSARIKRGWDEPCILWTLIVAASGQRKDPALDLLIEPLRELDDAARREYARRSREHEKAEQIYVRDFQRWKSPKGEDGPPPDKPVPPRRARVIVQDATVPALARVVAENPRASVLVVRREASAWVRAWGEYTGGAGADAERWLELHGGRFPSVDRVGAGEIHVGRCAVSFVGAVQPGTLRRILGAEHIEAGIVARLGACAPPPHMRHWSDAEVSEETRGRYAEVVRRLHALRPEEVTYDEGETGLQPQAVPLTPDARAEYARYVDALGEEVWGADDAEGAAAAKVEGVAVRLALVLELAEAAEREDPAIVVEVGVDAMRRGICIARWLMHEARRILAMLDGREEARADRESRELVEWVRTHGGSCTVRELSRGPRRYRPAGAAERALGDLVAAGVGTWRYAQPPEGGGHQERRFVLDGDGDGRPPDDLGNVASVAVAMSPGSSPDAEPERDHGPDLYLKDDGEPEVEPGTDGDRLEDLTEALLVRGEAPAAPLPGEARVFEADDGWEEL